jgi:hypothetical protein
MTIKTSLFKSSLFKSVALDSEDIADVVGKVPPDDHCGYFLIRGYLIPYSLLHRLAAILQCRTVDYGRSLDPHYVFSDLWDEFSDIEHEVMGECLMILLESKKMVIAFPPEVVNDHFRGPATKAEVSFVSIPTINWTRPGG